MGAGQGKQPQNVHGGNPDAKGDRGPDGTGGWPVS